MKKLSLYLLTAAIGLSGCQTTRDTGWTGDNAVPFETARATCESDVDHMPPGAGRDAAFEECMASNGWMRP